VTRPATGVTAAKGFRAAAVACGIRKQGTEDLALVVSDATASTACVFTRNQVQAAPILVSRAALRLSNGRARAVVLNAGNANACTGDAGLEAARATATETARLLGVSAPEVLVASTGVIGQRLPIEKLLAGLPRVVAALSESGGEAAAAAIMTTDLVRKESVRRVELRGGVVTIGGMAKGSGMIHPDMATTLAVVTTDAAVAPPDLGSMLRSATDRTFNRITVDGDTSTNDMIAALASGASGAAPAAGELDLIARALEDVLKDLALMIVRDGEGAKKLVEITVTGARSEADALQVARTIAGSPLVKTAMAGGDANWGRIVAAVGRSGIPVRPERLTVTLGDVEVLSPGYVSGHSEERASRAVAGDTVLVGVDLGDGTASATAWTCDLTEGYVRINGSYRS
jgi:glutamate N-acetyltransferase/amino-acid N-acetyltransferase